MNTPEILYYAAPGYASFDLTELIKDRKNIVLRTGPAFAVFVYIEPGQYEGHYLFPPEIKGKKAVSAAKKILTEMFTKHRAMLIHGMTPRSHRAARVINRALGFKPIGAGRNASDQECVHYILEAETWALSSQELPA